MALEAKIEKATADLAANKPTKIANSDAVALATYLSGLGFDVDADRINKWLVLLAVLIVECGAGVSIVVGTTLAAKPAVREPTKPADVSQGEQPATAAAANFSHCGDHFGCARHFGQPLFRASRIGW